MTIGGPVKFGGAACSDRSGNEQARVGMCLYGHPGCRADTQHREAGRNAFSDFFIWMCIAIDAGREESAALLFTNAGNDRKSRVGEEWRPLSDEADVSRSGDEYVNWHIPGHCLTDCRKTGSFRHA